jgi:serine/threonine protein kinase
LGFLHASLQVHEAGAVHGDIKAENVLLTSWGWAFLADFAPYKPTYLPADNPVGVLQATYLPGDSPVGVDWFCNSLGSNQGYQGWRASVYVDAKMLQLCTRS